MVETEGSGAVVGAGGETATTSPTPPPPPATTAAAAADEEEGVPEDSRGGAPIINLLPTCWANFDTSLLLQRESLTDPYTKAYPVYSALRLCDENEDEEQICTGKYFIPDFEEDPPSDEMQSKYLKSLILKQSIGMQVKIIFEFFASTPSTQGPKDSLKKVWKFTSCI